MSGTGLFKPPQAPLEFLNYRDRPLDFLIRLARYKFAARLMDPSDMVLDAGCGDGVGTLMLSGFAKRVVGVDVEPELIAHCRELSRDVRNVSFEIADLRDLSRFRRRFDTVVAMDVIEHFPAAQGATVVESLGSALNERGMLVIGTPNASSQAYASARRRAMHPFEYDFDGFKSLLSAHFRRALVFSMTDEVVSTAFGKLAWYFIGVCVK